jgi:AcrR family transcriptional regulator
MTAPGRMPSPGSLAADIARFRADFDAEPDLADLGTAARRVLAAAAALFYRNGAPATSVRDIARAAGLTPGAMYHHFSSRDELLYRLVRHGHDCLDAVIRHSVGSAGNSPDAALRAFVHAYVLGHLERPQLAQVVRREYLHLAHDDYAEIVVRRRAVRDRLSGILRAGARSGTFELIGGRHGPTRQAVMVLDMCSRTSEWFDPSGSTPAGTLADQYVAAALRLVGAVQQDPAGDVTAGDGPPG